MKPYDFDIMVLNGQHSWTRTKQFQKDGKKSTKKSWIPVLPQSTMKLNSSTNKDTFYNVSTLS